MEEDQKNVPEVQEMMLSQEVPIWAYRLFLISGILAVIASTIVTSGDWRDILYLRL